jgi:hypothetical protein
MIFKTIVGTLAVAALLIGMLNPTAGLLVVLAIVAFALSVKPKHRF